MTMTVSSTYLQKLQEDKITIKVFIDNGTMLQGVLTGFDDEFIIVDKCLVNKAKLISIALQSK